MPLPPLTPNCSEPSGFPAPASSSSLPSLPSQRPPRRHGHTRQRQGCQTCRGRKKKCNQSYPVCGHCSRLNLVCEWEAPRPLKNEGGLSKMGPRSSGAADTADTAAHSRSSQTTRISSCCARESHRITPSILFDPLLLLPSCSTTADVPDEGLVSSRRAMMRYYTATFALLLTTNTENNCFLSVLLPMAFDCPTLTCALAAFSAAHLALRNEAFRDVSLRHRGQVLAEFKGSLSQGIISEEMCLATTMVLCSMESISDPTDTWADHLAGAAATLLPPGNTQIPAGLLCTLRGSFEGRWLLRNFAYHDILMSVSMDRRPHVRGDYWICAEDGEHLADTYFGFAARILHLISEISHLNVDINDVNDQEWSKGEDSAALNLDSEGSEFGTAGHHLHRALEIERELHSWVCCHSPAVESASSPEVPLALHVLGEAYRHGALLHLYRTVRRHALLRTDVVRRKTLSSVSAICAAADAMPADALPECTMLFPLFIAGGEAEDPSEIATLRAKLLAINKWRHFCNVDKCISVLDEVWRLSSAGTRKDDAAKVDWLDIVERRGWKLAIT